MDAISLLKQDHRKVDALFRQFERAGPAADQQKKNVLQKIIRELSVHTAIEEQVFYPLARKGAPDTTENVLIALEQHHVAKWELDELEGMDPDDDRFEAKVLVLIDTVRHHVEEEEESLFPQVQAGLTRQQLDEIGNRLAQARESAPTRPHPRMPDEPPGNVVAGPAAAVVDRAYERGKEAVEQIREQVGRSGD